MLTNRKVYAFIFARSGSKGVKNKNLRQLNGRSLLAHTVDCAKNCSVFSDIFVSSNGQEILQAATDLGVKIIERPQALGSDTANELDSWKHAVQKLLDKDQVNCHDIFVSLPCTSPMRTVDDVLNIIHQFVESDHTLALGITPSATNPYFNMVTKANNGGVQVVNQTDKIVRRQDAPDIFDVTTVAYVSTMGNVMSISSVLSPPPLGVEVPRESCLDIDTEHDLKLAEALLSLQEKGNNNNENAL